MGVYLRSQQAELGQRRRHFVYWLKYYVYCIGIYVRASITISGGKENPDVITLVVKPDQKARNLVKIINMVLSFPNMVLSFPNIEVP